MNTIEIKVRPILKKKKPLSLKLKDFSFIMGMGVVKMVGQGSVLLMVSDP